MWVATVYYTNRPAFKFRLPVIDADNYNLSFREAKINFLKEIERNNGIWETENIFVYQHNILKIEFESNGETRW